MTILEVNSAKGSLICESKHPYSILGTGRYICLDEWITFMVNVGKYTIHGS